MLPPCKLGHCGWTLRGSEAVLARGRSAVTRVASMGAMPLSTVMSSTQPLDQKIKMKKEPAGRNKIPDLPKIGEDHGTRFAVALHFGRPGADQVPFGRRRVDDGQRRRFRHLGAEFAPFGVKDSLLDDVRLYY